MSPAASVRPAAKGRTGWSRCWIASITAMAPPPISPCLKSVANQMKGKCLCALGEFAVSPVLSTIAHFLDEYKAKVELPTKLRRKQRAVVTAD